MSRKRNQKDKYHNKKKSLHSDTHKKKTFDKSRSIKGRDFNRIKNQAIQGKIDGSGKGYAFFIPDDDSGDIFIPAHCLHGARHGDSVLVMKISEHRGNGEGEVIKILNHNITKFVGVYRNGYVVPDDKSIGDKIRVDKYFKTNIHSGTKVVAQFVENNHNMLLCAVIEELGKAGDKDAEMLAIIRTFDIEESFSKKTLKQVDRIPSYVEDYEKINRVDYTNDLVITIDGDDSKDFDDAISVVKNNDGFILYVHIADVSHYVGYNTPLDKDAFNRGTSIYFADKVIPMLPEKLSNGICSLNEGVDRLTLSVVIYFNNNGDMLSSEVHEGVINNKARMTYDKVQGIFDGDKELINQYKDIVPMLENAKQLMLLLNKKRMDRGAIDFDLAETVIVFDDNGDIKEIKNFDRKFSHRMIEEFMIIANEAVALEFNKKGIPFVYRVHEAPPTAKVQTLQTFLASMNIKFPLEPEPQDFSQLLNSVDDDIKNVVNRVALRSMSKANYKPENKGHYGLNSTYYCHFTAPIRRYPDLCIHRIIKYYLIDKVSVNMFSQFVEMVASRSSERERIADEATRRVENYLKARFMENKLGEEFYGIISGVTEKGVFVELDNSIEGMIKVENLPDSGYSYNENLLSLSNGSYNFCIGKKLKIIVNSVEGDKINFLFAE